MKEQFITKRFGGEALKLIDIINAILEDYQSQGYDLSLRQVFYQLVSKAIIENTERSYKNVGNLVSDARLAGLIDWEIIKDRGREMVQNPHWSSAASIVAACANQFRVDRWENQPNYVEVMVEKQALEGVLIPVCSEWDVPFTANKGYSSSSAIYEASKRFLQRAEDDKALFILYLGDHDPSGIDMTRDVNDRMELFLSGSGASVQRLALNMDQVREMNPPENPAKITDSRAAGYIKRFGHSSWELDAIEPRQLAAIVSEAIERLVDKAAWHKSGKRQQEGRDALTKVAAKMKL